MVVRRAARIAGHAVVQAADHDQPRPSAGARRGDEGERPDVAAECRDHGVVDGLAPVRAMSVVGLGRVGWRLALPPLIELGGAYRAATMSPRGVAEWMSGLNTASRRSTKTSGHSAQIVESRPCPAGRESRADRTHQDNVCHPSSRIQGALICQRRAQRTICARTCRCSEPRCMSTGCGARRLRRATMSLRGVPEWMSGLNNGVA